MKCNFFSKKVSCNHNNNSKITTRVNYNSKSTINWIYNNNNNNNTNNNNNNNNNSVNCSIDNYLKGKNYSINTLNISKTKIKITNLLKGIKTICKISKAYGLNTFKY